VFGVGGFFGFWVAWGGKGGFKHGVRAGAGRMDLALFFTVEMVRGWMEWGGEGEVVWFDD